MRPDPRRVAAAWLKKQAKQVDWHELARKLNSDLNRRSRWDMFTAEDLQEAAEDGSPLVTLGDQSKGGYVDYDDELRAMQRKIPYLKWDIGFDSNAAGVDVYYFSGYLK